ncbi:hypothetical protein PPACK8108_LOCUS7157 [Phakopsora pachyrhizi]|uniref:Uncharacterized protein n=1 Tax=Phakopsora pachyrhizi TaxID=170000 RepID=A0AAV0ASB4_PHAPC|nr:hypothetical protein PPACK8108_LOCUS7157 [Phakopsora pachyrhizi]
MPFATKSKGHCSDCTFQNSVGRGSKWWVGGSLPTGVVEDLVKEEDRKEVFGWISLDFENEGGTKEEEKLGGGAHQGQTDWGKITGATDL